MAGRRSAARMQLVEVDEASVAVPPSEPVTRPDASVADAVPPRGGALRVVRRWWPVGAAVVLAAGAVVLVGAARDRAFVERVGSVPGLVRPLADVPQERWRAPASADVGAVVAAGDALVLVSERDGRWVVTAHDARDGAVRWSLDAAPVQRSGFESSLVRCPSSGEDVGALVLCLVTEPRVVYSDDASIQEPAHTHVVALDAATGAQRGTWELTDELLSADRRGDDLVVATVDRDGHVLAERRAGTTGEALWSFRTPDVLDSALLGRVVDAWTERGVIVLEGVVTHVLDVDDGAVLTVGGPYRDPQVVALDEGYATWATVGGGEVHAADGEVRFPVAGLPERFHLDDGSAGDVLVVDEGPNLRGVDAATGDPLWSTPTMLDVRARVSDRLLLAGLTRFGVLDPQGGRLLWVSDAAEPAPWQPLTDGALVLAPGETVGGAPQLVGLGLDDGVKFWSVDLPPGVQRVDGFGGHLVVRTADEALLLS